MKMEYFSPPPTPHPPSRTRTPVASPAEVNHGSSDPDVQQQHRCHRRCHRCTPATQQLHRSRKRRPPATNSPAANAQRRTSKPHQRLKIQRKCERAATATLFTGRKGEKQAAKPAPAGGGGAPSPTAFFTLTFERLAGAVWALASICCGGAGGWRLMAQRASGPVLENFHQPVGGTISCSSRSPTIRSAGCCSRPSGGG